MSSPRRLLGLALAGALGLAPLAVAVTVPAAAAPADIRINEIISNSTTVVDSIELTNIGSAPVDVSGWIVKDNNDTRTLAVAAGTVVQPGAYVVVPVDITGGFGLGNGDAARIYLPDGSTLIDGHTYPGHSNPSWSRCGDGVGPFVQANAETLGAANDCPDPTSLVINEVESNGDPAGDWIEIANPTGAVLDASGLVVKDNDDTRTLTVPAGTTVAAGGYAVVFTEPVGNPAAFGLGGADSARLFTADGATLIDSHTWSAHAATTYGRCPDKVGAFATTEAATPGAANDCPVPSGATDLVINEIKSNPNPDFVELKNVSDHLVDVAGMKVADNARNPVVITTESTPLLPGELFVFEPDSMIGGFGLGAADELTLYLADGVTVVDSHSWTSHRMPSYGRCPDQEGLVLNAAASPGAENLCQPITVNEVESNGGTPGDWVELKNITDAPVDVSGWVLKDNDDTHAHALAAGTSIAPGAYLVVEESALGFGLGAADSVRLFRADATTVVDSTSWTTHAGTSYGRCVDGSGDFVTTRSVTKGAANDCPPPSYGVEVGPWPGSQTVVESDPQGAFVSPVSAGDVSGLAFDPQRTGVLWAIKNKNRLFKLTKVGGLWTPVTSDGWATGKDLHFKNGAGEPDTEGVTVGPDGAIYATSERDNVASSVPRNTILRFDPAAPGAALTATDEWDLTADFPELIGLPGGSNLGFEGVTWVPDSVLVAGGFVDQSTQAAYRPADYPGHGTGLFFTALENDGKLYAYALGAGSSHRIAVVSSGFPKVMEVSWDADRQRLWAACDDTCAGHVSVLKLGAGGQFAVETGYERPTGMPNLNNEGFAVAPQSTCAGGTTEVVWADDAGTGGHSLRSGTLPCLPVVPPKPPVATPPTGPAPVVRSATRTSATPATRRVRAGSAVKVRVVVRGGKVAPSGRVELRRAGKVLARGKVVRGRVVLVVRKAVTRKLSRGPKTFRVRYLGTPTTRVSATTFSLRIVR